MFLTLTVCLLILMLQLLLIVICLQLLIANLLTTDSSVPRPYFKKMTMRHTCRECAQNKLGMNPINVNNLWGGSCDPRDLNEIVKTTTKMLCSIRGFPRVNACNFMENL